MPKDKVFMNEIFDLVIENQHFLSFPYYFPDSNVMEKSRKSLIKKKLKNTPKDNKSLRNTKIMSSNAAGVNSKQILFERSNSFV